MPRLCIGLLSGTSMDAVDAVLADCEPAIPLLLASYQHPLDANLRSRLQTLIEAGSNADIEQLAGVHQALGTVFADAAVELLRLGDTPPESVEAIGLHGQTILHQPSANPPYTAQIGDPKIVAFRTGITTVYDFRSMDMIAGGQGAPLAPLLHRESFTSPDENRAVINLGGIANVTCLNADGNLSGWDTGPANCLLDAWIARHQPGKRYDKAGQWAASGQVNRTVLGALLSDSWLRLAPPKSTGTDYFNLHWLDAKLAGHECAPADVQASLVQFTADSIRQSLADFAATPPDRILVCGGGVHNTRLMQCLTRAFDGIPLASTADFGMDPDWVEGLLFAWLAARRMDGQAMDTPPVTGARLPVLLGDIVQL